MLAAESDGSELASGRVAFPPPRAGDSPAFKGAVDLEPTRMFETGGDGGEVTAGSVKRSISHPFAPPA